MLTPPGRPGAARCPPPSALPALPRLRPVARAAQPAGLPDDEGHEGQEGDQQQPAARPARHTSPPGATAAVLPTIKSDRRWWDWPTSVSARTASGR